MATGGRSLQATGGANTTGGSQGTGGASVDAGTDPSTATPHVSATARALVAAGAQLLDVRSASEYTAGHIEGAINIDVNELSTRLGELDPSVIYVVYCLSGHRSDTAVATLLAAGFTVYDLGAMSNW
jgi:rhodanese-related sulfurtransferase